MKKLKVDLNIEKEKIVDELKEYKKVLSSTLRKCETYKGRQIQSKILLSEIELVSLRWFEYFEKPLVENYQLTKEIIGKYHEPFRKLLELVGGKPSKRVLTTIFQAILKNYHIELLVPVQEHINTFGNNSILETILTHAKGIEINYLTEAIGCAGNNYLRASIILGWCATVNRMQNYIRNIGLEKINEASEKMCAITTGRYKRYSRRYDIHTLGELRMSVLDGDLLWILEFIEAIDGNQHEKLEICYSMRNTCAHPGESTLSIENLLSFYSDINNIIFTNLKFEFDEKH